MKRRKGKKHIVETTEEYDFIDTKYLCVGIVDIYHWDMVRASIAQKYRELPYLMKKDAHIILYLLILWIQLQETSEQLSKM